MRYGSVCSGIEAATQAWHPLGWKPSFFSEVDPFPRAVLEHHYPDVPLHYDFTTIEDGQYDPIDLLVGGTPCQSFSIAGLRGGLGDDRGNLALEYLWLADRLRPRWLVWENVPGVLSSLSHDAPDACPPAIDLDCENGPKDGEEVVVTDEYETDENHALWCFMAGASELGYDGGFRVIDAQFTRTCNLPFAVPQRRRRVFFVGYLGDWRRAAAVLFDRESLQRNCPPRREAGKGVTLDVAPSLRAQSQASHRLDTGAYVANSGDVSYCLAASAQQSLDAETETLIATVSGEGNAHALRGEGFDASEDGSGRGTPIIAFGSKDHGADAMDNVSPTLRAGGHSDSHANAGVPPAVAFAENSRAELRIVNGDGQVSSQLTTGGGKPGQGVGCRDDGAAFTLEARSTTQAVATSWAVRRLMPVECERLQGFPDGFTNVPWRGKNHSPDGRRYKALGNSMAVNVMRWLGDRIELVDQIPALQAPTK